MLRLFEENCDIGGRGPKQADILIGLSQSAELFHTPDGTGFADLDINGHREAWPIRGKGFRRWLARGFLEATQGAPSSEDLAIGAQRDRGFKGGYGKFPTTCSNRSWSSLTQLSQLRLTLWPNVAIVQAANDFGWTPAL